MGVVERAREGQWRLEYAAESKGLPFEVLEAPLAEIQFCKCSRPAEITLHLLPGDVVALFRQ